jgi:putative FmdB family regulatory protein
MPTYDYRCNECGDEFEHFQTMTSPVLRKCQKCGKLKLERLIGAGGGIIFKGAGFHCNDYKKPLSPPKDRSKLREFIGNLEEGD